MPMPMELQHASEDFERFLADARDRADLATRNQTYTMVEAVFRVFRRRLDLAEAIRFAGALPPILRAIFVADWNPDEPRRPFADRAALTAEVQAVREHHNFAPDTAIAVTAQALRAHADAAALDRVLATLPAEAAAFWAV
ncbi:DUF2267 domain-containing protein [Methyloraptor flagellatus]|uniref:DUF2267 domain-containing protein n=1 Tax=Methyloraptor flagellatus TaxID=3162530 RepID=A0AAU7XBU7_9HYPH